MPEVHDDGNGVIRLPKWAWSVGAGALAHAVYVLVAVETIRSKLDAYLIAQSGHISTVQSIREQQVRLTADSERHADEIRSLQKELSEIKRARQPGN